MPVALTDTQIAELVYEPKPLPMDFRQRLLHLRPKNGHESSQLLVTADSGHVFEIFLRQGMNPLDFSAILGYKSPTLGRIFRLRRYNGKSHIHGNRIEGTTFSYEFHIHFATARYQALGLREDTYAESSPRFANLAVALDCLVEDCGFEGVLHQGNLSFAN
jgi:hypothetical protein